VTKQQFYTWGNHTVNVNQIVHLQWHRDYVMVWLTNSFISADYETSAGKAILTWAARNTTGLFEVLHSAGLTKVEVEELFERNRL